MRRPPKKSLLTLLVILILAGLSLYRGWDMTQPASRHHATGGENTVQLTRAVDGDTLDVVEEGQAKTVRLIGINTPETVDPRRPVQCYGQEASSKTKQLVEGGLARLEVDPLVGDTDKYGRALRYAWLSDGRLLNRELVAQGFAFEYTYQSQPYGYQTEFKELAAAAREQGLGLWNQETCNGKA